MIIIGEKINGSIPPVAKAIAEKDAEFKQTPMRLILTAAHPLRKASKLKLSTG